MALAGGHRRGEIGFGRFLRNSAVTVEAISAGAARHTAERVKDRMVLAIQDTSEIILGGRKARARGYGPVGKGGQLGGVLLHPVLAVDADSAEVLGLADVAVWNRGEPPTAPHAKRPLHEKESARWLQGIERAAEVLRQAAAVTIVSDRESDIYEDFARRPATVHLLVRAAFNRRLETGEKLYAHSDGLAESARFTINVPATPGKTARQAALALRFGPVTLLRPAHGMPTADLKKLPESIQLSLVDIREVEAPAGVAPIHWRLLTSHAVNDLGAARKMLDYYRKRWVIEEYFHTLKTAGFRIEEADIGDPKLMLKFAALAAVAAVTVTQLLRARDNASGQGFEDAFDPDDGPMLEAICKDYEGPTPTARQTNPHPKRTMAYAAWVIGRLGGWTGYYGKPGPLNIARGLRKYQDIKYGVQINVRFV